MTRRALVLGGGGDTARSWEVGLLAGLSAAGIELREAELVVGTSTGALLGAQLGGGADLELLYRDEVSDESRPEPGRAGAVTGARLALASWSTRDPVRYRMRVGRCAKAAQTPSERRLLASIRERLPGPDWPAQRLLVTSVDADSGEFLAFDRDAQVSLAEAVGASCALPGVWPPVELYGRHWIDGGVRSTTNADLAAGYDRVVVLAPARRGFGPGVRVEDQVATLRRTCQVLLLAPQGRARRTIDRNPAGRRHRAHAAEAGRAQARAVRDAVATVWSG